MTGRRGVIFVEYDIGLLSLIRQCVVYDEDETWKRRDRSYRSTLRWKEIELSWLISQGMVYDEVQAWKWSDWLYRYSLWWKWDRTITWSIVQVYSMPKMKLNGHNWFDRVRSMTKTRKNNNVSDCTGTVYTEIRIELSWLIGEDMVYHKNQTGQRCDQHTSVISV